MFSIKIGSKYHDRLRSMHHAAVGQSSYRQGDRDSDPPLLVLRGGATSVTNRPGSVWDLLDVVHVSSL